MMPFSSQRACCTPAGAWLHTTESLCFCRQVKCPSVVPVSGVWAEELWLLFVAEKAREAQKREGQGGWRPTGELDSQQQKHYSSCKLHLLQG